MLLSESRLHASAPGATGYEGSDDVADGWALVDGGNFVLHVLTAPARRALDLERLWGAPGRAPQPLEVERSARGRGEHVEHEVAAVDERPAVGDVVGSLVAGRARRARVQPAFRQQQQQD